MALTKAILTENLSDILGLNKREGKDIVDSFFDEIIDSLIQGEEVKLSGFGNFSLLLALTFQNILIVQTKLMVFFQVSLK